MPTYSPEQALARSTGRAPLWGEKGCWPPRCGCWAVCLPRPGPMPGGAGRLAKGWALAQFTLGGGLLLLALSYRYWRARGARVRHAGKWLALLPVLFAVWGRG